jgi:hypothetical protein
MKDIIMDLLQDVAILIGHVGWLPILFDKKFQKVIIL